MNDWQRYWPAALLAGFGIFIFAPVLFFGYAFYGEEQIGFYYAISFFADLWAPSLPQWQGAYYGGVPVSLDQFYGAFYPINLALFSLFDFFFAHHLSMALATIAGLLCAYWFGRLEGWGRVACAALALCYFIATTFGWLMIGTLAPHSFAALPALLVAVRHAERRWMLAVLGGGAALGVGILAGFMQIMFYNCAIAGLYALFLCYERKTLAPALAYAGMGVLGLFIGLPQFLPSAALIDTTIRTSTYAMQNALTPSLTELVTFVLPPYFIFPFFNGGGSAGFYVGALGIACVLLALAYWRTRAVLFFAAVYALIMGFAFHLPVFSWINEHLPPFSHMGGNFRWSVAAAFPLAYLAAAGLDGLLRRGVPERAAKVVSWAAAAIAASLAAGALALQAAVSWLAASPDALNTLLAWYTAGRTLALPPEHYAAVLARALADLSAQFSLLSPRFLYGVLLWAATAAFFFFLPAMAPRARAGAALGLTLLAAGSAALLWSEHVPQSLYTEKPAIIAALEAREEDPKSYRFMGYLVGDGVFAQLAGAPLAPEEHALVQREAVVNNINLYWGQERMDGMEPYRTLRANRLLNTTVAYDTAAYAFDDESPALSTSALDRLYNRDVQKKVPIEEKLADLRKRLPLLSMMNVKYVYAPYELSAPELRPIETIVVPAGERAVMLHLYENARVLPRVYVASGQRFAASEREAFIATAENPDFSRTTVIECEGCTAHAGGGTIEIVRYESGYLELLTRAEGPRWLVFSESGSAGWRATIDGAAARIYGANYLFQAVEVPAGEHRVIFHYKDRFGPSDLL